MDLSRSLRIGTLAIESGRVSERDLTETLALWISEQRRPLADFLVDHELLNPVDRNRLETLLDRELDQGVDDDLLSELEEDEDTDEHDNPSISDFGADEAATVVAATETRRDRIQEATTMVKTRQGVLNVEINRFKLDLLHEQGGLGLIHSAFDRQLERTVAIKTIQEHLQSNPRVRELFQRESEITSRLEHPGTIPVYSRGVLSDGRPFYAMRFIQGSNLFHEINKFHDLEKKSNQNSTERSLALRQLLRRMIDVCQVIDHAHRKRYLHRDIKPENIMIGPNDETLVVDWGLARPFRQDESELFRDPESEKGVGTPAYMAPEQAAGAVGAQANPSIDIYSLGATLFAILTGQKPYNGLERQQIRQELLKRAPLKPREINPRIAAPLEAICLKAMNRDPEQRYGSPKALAQDLERWLADEPVSAYQDPLSVRFRRWQRRHRSIVIGASVLLLTSTVVLLIANILISRQERLASRARSEAERTTQIGVSLIEQLIEVADRRLTSDLPHEQRVRLFNSSKRLIEQYPDHLLEDQNNRRELGRFAARLANLERLSGNYSRAFPLYDEAIELLTPLAKESSTIFDDTLLLNEVRYERAEAERASDRVSQAVGSFRAVIENTRALADGSPRAHETHLVEALGHLGLGQSLILVDDLPSAAQELDRSIKLLKTINQDAFGSIQREINLSGSPTSLPRLLVQAQALQTQAIVFKSQDRLDKADAALLDAERLLSEAKELIGSVIPRNLLALMAEINCTRARIRVYRGDVDEALVKQVDDAVGVFRTLATEQPRLPSYQTSLARSLAVRVEVELALENFSADHQLLIGLLGEAQERISDCLARHPENTDAMQAAAQINQVLRQAKQRHDVR